MNKPKPVFFRSEAQERFSMCRKKRPFESEGEAQKANSGHFPYHCKFCGKWHLTSGRKRQWGAA